MNVKEVEKLLKDVKKGETSIEEALEVLKNFPYTDLGFARIDHHREMRTGYPEIIYCAGKSVDQVKEIFRVMSEKENNIIGTKGKPGNVRSCKKHFTCCYLLQCCKDHLSAKEKNLLPLQAALP